jgi:hypothetical protein
LVKANRASLTTIRSHFDKMRLPSTPKQLLLWMRCYEDRSNDMRRDQTPDPRTIRSYPASISYFAFIITPSFHAISTLSAKLSGGLRGTYFDQPCHAGNAQTQILDGERAHSLHSLTVSCCAQTVGEKVERIPCMVF